MNGVEGMGRGMGLISLLVLILLVLGTAALQVKKPGLNEGAGLEEMLVAGVGFEPTTFRL